MFLRGKKICWLLLAFATFTTQAAQIYKWVDENGKVHYSDKPMNDKAKTVNIKNDISAERQKQAKKRVQEQLNTQRKRIYGQLEEEHSQKQQAAKKEADEKKLKLACARAKEALRILDMQTAVYNVNAEGERKYISDEQRASKKKKLQQQIGEHCN